MATRSENVAPCARLGPLAETQQSRRPTRSSASTATRTPAGGSPSTSASVTWCAGPGGRAACRLVRPHEHLGRRPRRGGGRRGGLGVRDGPPWRRPATAATRCSGSPCARTGADSRSAPTTERSTGSAWSPSPVRRSASRCTREPGGSGTEHAPAGFVALEPRAAGRGVGRPTAAVRRPRRGQPATRTSVSSPVRSWHVERHTWPPRQRGSSATVGTTGRPLLVDRRVPAIGHAARGRPADRVPEAARACRRRGGRSTPGSGGR